MRYAINDIEIAFGFLAYCKSVETASIKPLCIEDLNVFADNYMDNMVSGDFQNV